MCVKFRDRALVRREEASWAAEPNVSFFESNFAAYFLTWSAPRKGAVGFLSYVMSRYKRRGTTVRAVKSQELLTPPWSHKSGESASSDGLLIVASFTAIVERLPSFSPSLASTWPGLGHGLPLPETA